MCASFTVNNSHSPLSLSLSPSLTRPLKWHFTLTPYSQLKSFDCLTSAILLFFSRHFHYLTLFFSPHICLLRYAVVIFSCIFFSLFITFRFKYLESSQYGIIAIPALFLHSIQRLHGVCVCGFFYCPVGTFLSVTRLSISLMLS